MLKWRLLTFQVSKNYSKAGLMALIFTFLQISSINIQNTRKTLKAWSLTLGNFSFKLLNFLDYPKTTWKKKDIGKIGLKKSLKTILLLSWEDPRRIPRKLQKEQKTKGMSKTSNLQNGLIQLLLFKLSLVLSIVEPKFEPYLDKNLLTKRKSFSCYSAIKMVRWSMKKALTSILSAKKWTSKE